MLASPPVATPPAWRYGLSQACVLARVASAGEKGRRCLPTRTIGKDCQSCRTSAADKGVRRQPQRFCRAATPQIRMYPRGDVVRVWIHLRSTRTFSFSCGPKRELNLAPQAPIHICGLDLDVFPAANGPASSNLLLPAEISATTLRRPGCRGRGRRPPQMSAAASTAWRQSCCRQTGLLPRQHHLGGIYPEFHSIQASAKRRGPSFSRHETIATGHGPFRMEIEA